MTERIEAQIERFAPGLPATSSSPATPWAPADVERHNPNYVGGDINGGVQDLRQLFTRPAVRPVPYATPDPRHLHLLVVHAAGRRGARHVRLLGRAGRPCGGRSETTLGRPFGRPGKTSLRSGAQHLNVLVSVPFAPSSAVKVARMSRVLPLHPIPE